MLQQTQVDTVIPYFRRFLRFFPTIARLAEAPTERVLELWSGLGYYRRARNLHLAAQKVARELGGRFPSTYTEVRSLPGIGDYTARAVLSIVCNQPYAVVDGNVARVIARLAALAGNISQPAFRRSVEYAAARLISRRRPGDFNQALMELGQTICLPRSPRCGDCPLRRWCRARAEGDPERYPSPRPRRATELSYLATAVLHRAGSNGRPNQSARGVRLQPVALIRGLDEGLMPDLWNFPAAFGSSRAQALLRLKETLLRLAPPMTPPARIAPRTRLTSICRLKHSITYRSILVDVYGAEFPAGKSSAALRWFALADLEGAAVSRLARKIAAADPSATPDTRPKRDELQVASQRQALPSAPARRPTTQRRNLL